MTNWTEDSVEGGVRPAQGDAGERALQAKCFLATDKTPGLSQQDPKGLK